MEHFITIESSILDIEKLVENNNPSGYNNVADQFLPIGTKGPKDHKLGWDRVFQSLIEDLFQLSLGKMDIEAIKTKILESFRDSRDTRELVDVIDELFFSPNSIKNITPLAYLVSNHESSAGKANTMVNIIRGLLNSPLCEGIKHRGNNPLESLLINKILHLCQPKTFDRDRLTYLPFLAKKFTEDIRNLTQSPSYFLSELESLINLYTFLYLSQLTTHLCVPSNRYKTPVSQPLYFILETESASKERYESREYGYKRIFSKTGGIAFSLFPYLGYLNNLSKEPSWMLINYDADHFTPQINCFNQSVGGLFDEVYRPEDSLQAAINSGLNLQIQIFNKSTRKGVNKKVVEVFEKIFAAEFITDRKAAGKYFVLNSNMILLLTNLVIIGSSESKLLIDDVIEGFKERGIWLDIKSKKALLKFYENVGNIEKLSDSGDAVYVKTTI
jgi:DNA phosphorothioation-dependent restriction protein DptG